MIPIHDIFDARHQRICVGDYVSYCTEATIGTGSGGMLPHSFTIRGGEQRFSRVVKIEGDDYGGFAECGRKIYVTLKDGHKVWGDSENGGWNLLKLVEQGQPGIPANAFVCFLDGDKWCCVRIGFKNLQESKAGFGDSMAAAMIALQLDEKL